MTSRRPPASRSSTPTCTSPSLGKGASLEMEMTVERGVGYRMADKNKKAARPDRRDPGRLDLLARPQGLLRRGEHARRADDRPRPADPGRRDRRLGDAARGGRLGRRHAARARQPLRRAGGGRERHGRPGRGRAAPQRLPDHDRGAEPVGALLQLPEARGHQHGRRPGAEVRVRAHGHPQLRAEVDRRGQGQARRARVSVCGRSNACRSPRRVRGWARTRPIRSCCSPRSRSSCS